MRAGEWMERGAGPWRDQVRELQLCIRNRFRVAVDRRRHRLVESDYSSPVKRWTHRLRSMWVVNPSPDTPTSSMRFYRKKVGKAINDESILLRMIQALAVPVIGNACHVFMHGLNHVQIYGVEKLQQALKQRPEGKPLLTVSNHVAAFDDPLVIASLLPPSILMNAHDLRWTLCATDRCFSNPLMSAFSHCLKVLPVSRGDGVYQKGMDSALSKLNNGGWVHIFPEGSRSRDGGRTMAAAKRGVGRLVIDADTTPIVIPFVHAGMQEILPIGTHFPKIGKNVTVLIGDPLFLDDLVIYKDDPQQVSTGILYDAVSTRIGHQLQELKAQVDLLAAEHELEIRDVDIRERATGIWQQVDWEAFGMQYMVEEPAGSTNGATHDHPIQVLEQSPKSNSSTTGATHDHPMQVLEQSPKSNSSRNIRIRLVDEGGIVSRIRGFMDPSELMGFAARGLFINGRIKAEWH